METELTCLALVDADPDNVRWQEVAGELDALEFEIERGGQCVRQGGLAYAGYVFEEKVAAGDQAGEGQLDLAWLAEQHAVDLCQCAIQSVAEHFIVERSRR
jgi:hypothetical protein